MITLKQSHLNLLKQIDKAKPKKSDIKGKQKRAFQSPNLAHGVQCFTSEQYYNKILNLHPTSNPHTRICNA